MGTYDADCAMHHRSTDPARILERYFCAEIHHFATIWMTQAQAMGM